NFPISRSDPLWSWSGPELVSSDSPPGSTGSSMFHASPLRGWMRAPSVHGGAGGCGTRVSLSTCAGSWGSGHADTPAHCTEKLTMQNLNMRLSNYLEKVRSLEEENRKLELNIRELCLKKTVTPHNFSRYFETINDLRVEISRRCSVNQSLTLQMDNHRLAAEDFRMKYETELSLRKAVDADIFRLRKVRDGLTLGISDLEIIVENLQEELVTLKKNHSEVRAMHQLQVGQTSTVNVEVDAANSVDLTEVLEKVRVSYEAVLKKNKLELEAWYHCKVRFSRTTTFETELTELKRTYQSLEIKRESVCAEVQLLRENLEEANSFCSITLSQQQETIYSLEMQLQELKVSLQQMQVKYSMLLQLRMKLEAEIAEYRRLLEGEHQEKKRWDNKLTSAFFNGALVGSAKRVRTIVEEIIDGQVVSSSQKTQVQTIQ
uniref:Keratin 99 n=1 Tax=Oryzias latipes TaxID=8090 RepID=A0A3P9H2U5_ORYLA